MLRCGVAFNDQRLIMEGLLGWRGCASSGRASPGLCASHQRGCGRLSHFGILSIFRLGSVFAVVCGHMARAQIRRTGEAGDDAAIAGLILGYLGS